MFGAKQPISLVKIFRRSQFKITLYAVLLCSLLFLASSFFILHSLIHENARSQLLSLKMNLEQNDLSKDPLSTYQNLIDGSIVKKQAQLIEIRSRSEQLLYTKSSNDAHSSFEKFINNFFFSVPITDNFKNKREEGEINFYIRSFNYLPYYTVLLLSISLMLLMIPLLVAIFGYHTHRFLNRNISPIVQAIHQFNNTKFVQAKQEYSYIKELQFFSESFNTLLNKFESTKQNLAEQNHLLDWQAHHDVLTQLPNRQYFQEYLLKEFNHNQHNHMVVLFIDNNKFKHINDTYGHQAGDAVLIETANRLKSNLKSTDFIARLGGDEFAVILRRIENYQDLVNICERLRFCCSTPLLFENQEIHFSFSIGASYAYHATNIEELLHYADLAMYKAKLAEKRWHIYKREAAFAYTDYK